MLSTQRGIVLLTLWAAAHALAASTPDTDAWDRTLEAHVRAGGVDYAALAADRADLDTFLASLGTTDPSELEPPAQVAFWLNAYNAVVVELVLERYPDLESVKEVDGFFDRLEYPVAGRSMTPDAIESAARALGDPRVHFALVCASTSCPDLRGEAYRGERIDGQLEDQLRTFLADPGKGLRFEPASNTVWLSSIFEWYAGDFTGGSTVVAFFARGRLLRWLLPHLPAALAAELRERAPRVRYLDYDWKLNDRPAPIDGSDGE